MFFYFISGTIEERIYQRQVSKQGLSGTVVDMGKGAEHTSFSSSELRDLFSLTETPCLTHDLLNCGCSMDGAVIGRQTDVSLTPTPVCHQTYADLSLSQMWWKRRRTPLLAGPASSVVKVTVRDRRRSISACLSSCSGDTSPGTRTRSRTPTLITHESTSPSRSRPPFLT